MPVRIKEYVYRWGLEVNLVSIQCAPILRVQLPRTVVFRAPVLGII